MLLAFDTSICDQCILRKLHQLGEDWTCYANIIIACQNLRNFDWRSRKRRKPFGKQGSD